MVNKKAFQITMGIAVAIAIWAGIAIIGFHIYDTWAQAQKNQRIYPDYETYATLQEAATLTDEGYVLNKSVVITGDQTLSGMRLLVQKNSSGYSITVVLKGNLTLEEIVHPGNKIIIEGNLTVEKLTSSPHASSSAVVYGTLTAHEITGYINFDNYGKTAVTGESNLMRYDCYSGSSLYINKQTSDCYVALPGWDTNPKQKVVFTESLSVIYAIPHGRDVDYVNEIQKPEPVVVVLIWVFAANILLGIICLLLASIFNRVSGNSYFDGNAFLHAAITLWRYYANLLTLGMLKPYIDAGYYRWKWRHTVIDNRRMAFWGSAEQVFYRNMLWQLLLLATLYIYWFWAAPKRHKWAIEGIGTADGAIKAEQYLFGAADFFSLFKDCILLSLGFVGLNAFLYLILSFLFSFRIIFLAIAASIAYIAVIFLLSSKFYATIWNGYFALSLRRIKVGTITINGFVTYKDILLIVLLSLLTAGGYAYAAPYFIEKKLISRA